MRKKFYIFLLFLLVLAFEIANSVAAAHAQEPVVTIVCKSVHTFVNETTGKKYQKCQTQDGEILPLIEGEVQRLSPSKAILTTEQPKVDNTMLLNLTIGGFFVMIVCAIVALSLSLTKKVKPS